VAGVVDAPPAFSPLLIFNEGVCSMPRIIGFLMLLVAVALVAGSGCGTKKSSSTPPAGTTPATTPSGGDDVFEFDLLEIELIPDGDAKTVKVKKGKVEKAEAPKDSGIKAEVKDGTVSLSAQKDAKVGDHEVTIKGDKKDAKIKVKVKAK
jgi:hypothetical protein